MNNADRALCAETMRVLSNPEGVNQYTGGGGSSEHDHRDAAKEHRVQREKEKGLAASAKAAGDKTAAEAHATAANYQHMAAQNHESARGSARDKSPTHDKMSAWAYEGSKMAAGASRDAAAGVVPPHSTLDAAARYLK